MVRQNYLTRPLMSIFLILGFASCKNANADNPVISNDVTTAAFRFTRTAFAQGATISQLDSQCVAEFGNNYTTGTFEEGRSLAKLVTTTNGVFTYILNTGNGASETSCGSSYCAVLCIKK